MTEIAADARNTRIASADGAAHPAPGRWFFLATAFAIVAALDTTSRFSFGLFLPTAIMWCVLAAIWLVRFIAAAGATRREFRLSYWVRWLAIPVALGLVFVACAYRLPIHARFALSESALDQVAAEVAAGGSLDRGWIGLYPVERVERTDDGMRFIIGGLFGSGLFDPIGFAYSTDAEPPNIGREDIYERFAGSWWLWQESW